MATNTFAGMDLGAVLKFRRVITAAELKTLSTAGTPLLLLPQPGVGRYYRIHEYKFTYNAGAIAYTGGGTIALLTNFISGPLNHITPIPATFLTSTVTKSAYGIGSLAGTGTSLLLDNQDLRLGSTGANFATGDGTMTVDFTYSIESFIN